MTRPSPVLAFVSKLFKGTSGNPHYKSIVHIPEAEVAFKAIARLETRKFLDTHFGSDWFKRGDPRTLLDISLPQFQAWVAVHGIPTFILQEGVWSGDNHFVLAPQDGEWLFGFAERGTANLWSAHPSLEDARLAATTAIWDSFLSDADPSFIVEGAPAGAPFA